MPTETIAIEALLPHRGPMLLISEIISFEDRKAATRATAGRHWPLADDQGVDALILIELVAQTAAVNNGWELFKRDGPGGDHRGWIVGIKLARFFVESIPLGTDIVVTSENSFEYENFREIHGEAFIGSTQAAVVELQLMQAKAGEAAAPESPPF